MPIDHESLLATELTDISVSYSEQDVMLYALGVGLASDPMDQSELAYVSEYAGLSTLPTFANMVIPESILAGSGCDMQQILHRSQSLQIFRPLPASAELLVNQRVASAPTGPLFDAARRRGGRASGSS